MDSLASLSESDSRQIESQQAILDLTSIVKELTENSIDAKASQIEVTFENNGTTFISVKDNGTGMSLQDLKQSVAPHSTSKLSSHEDLSSHTLLGFRGEALAAICQSSKSVTIITRSELYNEAYKIQVDDGNTDTTPQTMPLELTPFRNVTGSVVTVCYPLSRWEFRRLLFEKNCKQAFHDAVSLIKDMALMQCGWLGYSIRHITKNDHGPPTARLICQTKPQSHPIECLSHLLYCEPETLKGKLLPVEIEGPFPCTWRLSGYVLHPSKTLLSSGANNARLGYSASQKASVMSAIDHSQSLEGGKGGRSTARGKIAILTLNRRVINFPPGILRSIDSVYRRYTSKNCGCCFFNVEVATDSSVMIDFNRSVDKRNVSMSIEGEIASKLSEALVQLFAGSSLEESITKESQSDACRKRKSMILTPGNSTSTEQPFCRLNKLIRPEHPPVDESSPLIQNKISAATTDSLDTPTSAKYKVRTWSPEPHNVPTGSRNNPSSPSNVDSFRMGGESSPSINDEHTPNNVYSGTAELVSCDTVQAQHEKLSQMEDTEGTNKTGLQSSLQNEAQVSLADGIETLEKSLFEDNSHVENESQYNIQDEQSEDAKVTCLNAQDTREVSSKYSNFGTRIRRRSKDLCGQPSLPLGNLSRGSVQPKSNKSVEDLLPEKRTPKVEPLNCEKRSNLPPTSNDSNYDMVVIWDHSDLNRPEVVSDLSVVDEMGGSTQDQRRIFSQMSVVGNFRDSFIVASRIADDGDGWEIYLIDQHAADEKHRFERLNSVDQVHSQPLVNPMTVSVSPERLHLVEAYGDGILKLNGFAAVVKHNAASVCLTAVPSLYGTVFGVGDFHQLLDMVELMHGFSEGFENVSDDDGSESQQLRTKIRPAADESELQQRKELRLAWEFGRSGTLPRPPRLWNVLAMKACRSAVKFGTRLTHHTMKVIIENLCKLEHPWNCPHGRPTTKLLMTLPRREF